MKECEQLTPQLARLVILKWALATSEKWSRLEDEPGLTEHEKKLIADAMDNYVEQIKGQITYQERLCK